MSDSEQLPIVNLIPTLAANGRCSGWRKRRQRGRAGEEEGTRRECCGTRREEEEEGWRDGRPRPASKWMSLKVYSKFFFLSWFTFFPFFFIRTSVRKVCIERHRPFRLTHDLLSLCFLCLPIYLSLGIYKFYQLRDMHLFTYSFFH